MRRREVGTWIGLALVVGALGGVAWLTRHPDAELVTRAAEWPWIGGLARSFREAYLGPRPEAGGDAGGMGGAPTSAEPRAEGAQVVVVPADPDAVGARPRVWVPDRTPVLPRPEPDAPPWTTTGTVANVPLVGRRGDWFLVRLGGRDGWVHLPGYRESTEPPLGSEPEPLGPLPGRPAEPALLAAARRAFGGEPRTGTLGPYPLLTDLAPGPLVDRLDRVAGEVEPAYRRRYGLLPVDEPRETIVLYRGEASYRVFQAGEEELAGLPATGHSGGGLVALHAAGAPSETESTLVHEIAHLLNRRALGPALPPWLDEGLADDLAQGQVTADGRLLPERLGGETVRLGGNRVERRGGVAGAVFVDAAFEAGRAVPLPALLAMDGAAFVRSEERQLHYAESALFVRFLLSAGDPALAGGFTAYLRGIAAGGPVDPPALGAALGVGWEELEVRFRAWLHLAAR